MAGRPRTFDEDTVLERAMHVFWKKGYERAGISDLEEATGLGRQSLYGAFGDKRTLFFRVVDFYFANVLRPGLVDVLDAAGSGRENIERVLVMWEALATSADFHGCLVGNAASHIEAHDEEMAELLRRKLRLLEDAFTRALRRAVDAGEVRPDLDARGTARALLTLSQGLSVIAQVRKEPAFVRGVVQAAQTLLG
jgi:TetR/AcrR family transcriptional repressor of nem operon